MNVNEYYSFRTFVERIQDRVMKTWIYINFLHFKW